MSKQKAAPSRPGPNPQTTAKSRYRRGGVNERLVITTGCPSGIGPEISVRSAALAEGLPPVLVGDFGTLLEAAELVGVPRQRLVKLSALGTRMDAIAVVEAGEVLNPKDRRAGAPSKLSGRAQLAYINAGYQLVKSGGLGALVTAPVNKAVISGSGARGGARFIGHTEWLEALDGAPFSVMCFWAPKLVSSLVTTHLALSRVPRALNATWIAEVVVSTATFLRRIGQMRPKVVVCSLNPHASEAGMFGREEAEAISPGIALAVERLGKRAQVLGPLGAETAFRKAYAGEYSAVVAMYHDQATIPMKLVAFGQAVNVTLGLSIDRTSVDHGTAYDIAWQNRADITGMQSALSLAARLAQART